MNLNLPWQAEYKQKSKITHTIYDHVRHKYNLYVSVFLFVSIYGRAINCIRMAKGYDFMPVQNHSCNVLY